MITEAALAAAGVVGLRELAHRAIVHGLRAPRLRHDQQPVDPAVHPSAIREVRISGPRARQLFGWIVMPTQLTLQPAPAVLVMHGWGANAATMWPVVAPLHAAGFAVLLMDARCHGRSDGEAFTSMPRFAEDIASGLAWLRARSGIAGNRMALLGHSVGAGAALLHAARHDDVCAVISLSAFAHPREMMRRFMAEKRVPYPVIGWYVLRHVQRVIGATFDEIAPLATLPRVRCPVLLVHGRSDKTVPVGDAQRLLATSAHARLILVDGNHDLRDGLAARGGDLVDFLQAAFADCRHDPPTQSRSADVPSGAHNSWENECCPESSTQSVRKRTKDGGTGPMEQSSLPALFFSAFNRAHFLAVRCAPKRQRTRSFEQVHAGARAVIEMRRHEVGKGDGYSNAQFQRATRFDAGWQNLCASGKCGLRMYAA